LLLGTDGISAFPTMVKKDTQIGNGIILYVGGSGPGNYSKIQEAIDNALDGDTIFVYNNSSPYFENLFINKSIRLIGEQKETTIIDANKNLNVITIFANNVTISGFTIQNSGNLLINSGIELRSSNDTISGNIISKNYMGIGMWTTGPDISNYNTITSNIITSNKGNSIYIWGSTFILISNNTFLDNDGINLDGQSSNINISNNVFHNEGILCYSTYIYNNIISNNSVNGKPLIYMVNTFNKIVDNAGQVILVGCHNIVIRDQNLSHATVGLMLIGCNNCLITKNTITNNGYFGIVLLQSSNNNISKNTISDNGRSLSMYTWEFGLRDGILLEYSNHNTIIWNIISSNLFDGINFYFSNNNTVSTNTIKDNCARNIINGGSSLSFLYSSNNVIYHNNFLHNLQDVFFNNATGINFNGNYWNRPRILPKIIHGINKKNRRTFTLDWHPASKQYDLPIDL